MTASTSIITFFDAIIMLAATHDYASYHQHSVGRIECHVSHLNVLPAWLHTRYPENMPKLLHITLDVADSRIHPVLPLDAVLRLAKL